ncbi:hypothetical protein L3X38_032050 [Prunus dulcis]|uniref:Uncharacterized protein n=1 Tax=Prunus dulcis TaxID=3755 RepID=A0AAD4VEE0_PRUDU|nr:hypothetical protein L3X38_032050 [Prunus dulcis]
MPFQHRHHVQLPTVDYTDPSVPHTPKGLPISHFGEINWSWYKAQGHPCIPLSTSSFRLIPFSSDPVLGTGDCPPVAAAVHTLKEPCVSDSEDSDATDSEMLPGPFEGSLVF